MSNNELKHYGILRKSGRYKYGSTGNGKGGDTDYAYQRSASLLKSINDLKKQGLSDTEIAKGLGMKAGEYRNRKTIAIADQRAQDRAMAIKLLDKGMSKSAIGRRMGKNESTIRNLLDPVLHERSQEIFRVGQALADEVTKSKYVDIGAGVEHHLGISREKLNSAVQSLADEGFKVYYFKVKQAGTGKDTSLKILCAPESEWKEVNAIKETIQIPNLHTKDGGKTISKPDPVKSVSSKKIQVVYAEDGGSDKDGVIEIRRGNSDLDLGTRKYAQVRIGVDDTHYLKGMAVYSDDLPDGVDIRFNTNKHKGTPMLGKKDNTVLKLMSDDPDNPFGAAIKVGGQRGALNIVNEEGDWEKWSRNLSSQMLSKQPKELIKRQLDLSYAVMAEEFEAVNSLTNPAVKKHMLLSFAEDCDAASMHLKAAAMPRQNTQVILPFPGMKENQVYAPNYNNGERIVLIRHPHGGPFEIPELVVNNNYKPAKSLLGNAPDAIGINPKVAQQLSGADFDGDTVITIPTNGKTIKTSSPLKGLKDFDPKESYPPTATSVRMKKSNEQSQMGNITNLITDMTIRGASEGEITRAIKHSMVIIDSQKHGLNYKQSEIDNDIQSLKTKYQGGPKSGASTLLSRASSDIRIPQVSDYYKIDPKTGAKIYTETGNTYISKKTGKETKVLTKTKQMYTVDDAFELSSGSQQESYYAQYANKLKALANEARKEHVAVPRTKYSPTANKTYEAEVASLKAKLNLAQKNAPLERKAQLIANKIIEMKKEANPDLTPKELKKITGQAINEARSRIGAKKEKVNVTPKEWEAIQAGAVTNNTILQILNNSDTDRIRELAMPKQTKILSTAKLNKAKAMTNSGYTQAEIAKALGVSPSLVSKSLNN